MTPDLEECRKKGHPIVECEWTAYCLVDHFRTDHSFAIWSQSVLARAMAKVAA